MRITALTDTFLKKDTIQSSQLTGKGQLHKVNKGQQYAVESWKLADRGHTLTELSYGLGEWFIFNQHWNLTELEAPITDVPSTKGVVNLDVPFRSQRDNKYAPYQACNLTSVAMVLDYFDLADDKDGKQLEDILFKEFEIEGKNKYLHSHLSKEMRDRGLHARFTTKGKIEEIKRHLDKGYPCIISGSFTRGGHIIVVRGYDDKGLFVNDPYGEVLGRTYKYQATTGENLHYSYGLIKWACDQTAGTDNIWTHFISFPGFTPKFTKDKSTEAKAGKIYYDLTPARLLFLDLIAWCEGTDKSLDTARTGYNIIYGYKTFSDFSKHPRKRVTAGGWTSSAAGRYQIMDYTEDDLLKQMGKLTDFSPSQQDERAIHLIKRRNALDAVDSLNLNRFCNVCSWEWASIPPARYGQPIKTMANIKEAFIHLRQIYKI